MSARDKAGRWQSGESPNPGGRPKGVAALIRRLDNVGPEGSRIISKLWQIAIDGRGREQLESLKVLLERGYGRTPEVTLTGELSESAVDERLQDLSDDQLEGLLSLVGHSDDKDIKQAA